MAKITIILKLSMLVLLLNSCVAQLMNKQTYNQISVGMSVEEACTIAGQPYRISPDQNCQKYEYIERFDIGPNVTNHNVYVLTVQNGVVVDKYQLNETPRVNFSTP